MNKGDISRRDFFKMAGIVAAGAAFSNFGSMGEALAQAPIIGSEDVTKTRSRAGSKAKVYFTKHIDADHLIKLYDRVSENIYGKVAIKLHTGEQHGPNILPRDMVKAFQAYISNSNIVETNTMYPGDRDTTEKHRETLKVNGWTFCPVDIMDEDGAVSLPVRNALHLPEVSMGAHIVNYDSMIVLTHFKGHAMGGFGGSLKNIAIGCASGQVGKRQVHGLTDYGKWVTGGLFMELMADSGKAICDHFGKQITFLNVLRRMSVDCDCAGTSAAEPVIPDLGMLASTDILAIDRASVDLVYGFGDDRKKDLIERIESREGLRQLSAMKELNMGSDQYELVSLD
ncbi:MAG: DUF362 domain-containing protein [Selenomonadaceae bacterium]|nr:DUF362 domain-containing protein [Selenomonadaceae bacterium]